MPELRPLERSETILLTGRRHVGSLRWTEPEHLHYLDIEHLVKGQTAAEGYPY